MQSGTGSYSANESIARYIELRNTSNDIIDFEMDANNKLEMNYWDAELNDHPEGELIYYQWVKESTEEWWTPLTGTIETATNLSTPDNSPYSTYFDPPNWYSLNFYGKFTLGSESTLLAVEWLYFTADWQDETYSSVQLKWETATETNSDYYEIQRSDDMHIWETIKSTEAAGFSTQNIEYTDYDESPPADVDIIYYRLKQVDFDGNYKYSDIDAVIANDNVIEIISIYPNPADDEITVEIESTENTRIHIYVWDKLGKTVILKQAEVIKGKNVFNFDVSHLASSIYTIQAITESGQHKTEREFVK
ncbi:MAG: T9SS type A sorting domain-containing protein [Bacteroidota bacterium]|nr:T9SS type A sorting domain-containing protein [Bacteroidota bacterium]